MSNIHLLIGEELVLKDLRVKEILANVAEYEYETLYIDSYKGDNYTDICSKIDSFLNTYDLFGNAKALKLVAQKPLQVNAILSKIDSFNEDNILIIDLRCPEYLMKNIKIEHNNKILKPEKFFKFKDYEKEKVYGYIQKLLIEHNINFKSEYDLELSKKYLFENSLNSYSFIYNQIKKIALLNKDILTYDNILFTVGGLSDKNSYRICDSIFKFDNTQEIVEYLEDILSNSNPKMFSIFINTLANKLYDYILISNGSMCRVKANYYTFKDSKVKILDCNHFIEKLNQLSLCAKKKSIIPKEEFLLTILEHLQI